MISKKISDWALQWKVKFNPDPNKQSQEVHFSNRTNKDSSLSITFNNIKVETISSQKHLGLILDERLNFDEHLESKINKCYKVIGFLERLSNKLPRDALLLIYKSFVRSHLDSGDIVYNKPNNESFTSRLERVQYKACLTITMPFKVHLLNAFTKNLVWNPSVIENRLVSLLFSIK